jgi:hypothetical protein
MMILNELDVAPSALLQGIVETDDTGHRESRKGSREWVRHFREPARHPAPPRKRWKDWGRNGPPGAITMAWREHVLATTDRSGALMLEHMPDKTLPSINARVAIVRMRDLEPTLAYVKKRTKDGKSKSEVIRCLKRYIIREIYSQLCVTQTIKIAA